MTHAEMEQATVTIIAKIKGRGLWKKSFPEGMEILQAMLKELNIIWGIEVIFISQQDSLHQFLTGGGNVNSDGRKMKMSKVSLMTFLHEYYHCLALQKGFPNNEEEAQWWSHMIFKEALPRIYDKAVREGRFFHVIAE